MNEMSTDKIDTLRQFRSHWLQEIALLSTDQLQQIPAGFNNNILWNLGHLLASMQLIFYKRAGLPLTVDEQFISPFLPGTVPDVTWTAAEIATIQHLSVSSLDAMQKDYWEKDFSHYIQSENIERLYGIKVSTIDDALDFLLFHEGYHGGRIITIKKLVKDEKTADEQTRQLL
ncbi:MAG: DinB family protein [Bacteroidota bacterium]|nr:DinB family protein [Bacteroidota bacterium]